MLLSKVIKILRVEYLLKSVFWTAKYLNDSTCKPAGLAFPNIPRFEYYLIHFRSNMHVSLDSGYHYTTKYVFLTKNGSVVRWFFFRLGVSLLILILFRSINSWKNNTLAFKYNVNYQNVHIDSFNLNGKIIYWFSVLPQLEFFYFVIFFSYLVMLHFIWYFYFCHVFSFVTDFGI